MWVQSALRGDSKTDEDSLAAAPSTLPPNGSSSAALAFAPMFTAGAANNAATATTSESTLPSERPASSQETPPLNGSGPISRRSLATEFDLEMVHKLTGQIAALEGQILGVERDVEDVQEALLGGGVYRGRRGEALVPVEERLARKEEQLREKERLLREEKVAILRIHAKPQQQQHSVPTAVPQKKVSFVMTSACVDDPSGEKQEQRRLSQLNQLIKDRRLSISGTEEGDEAGNDTIANVYKLEEDSRLLARLGAFQLPILVSTLLSGFTLVLFDVAATDLGRQLAVVSFGLETSASTVLCLIAFHGQQLYSHATDIKPLTRKFLHRMCPITIAALVIFALGVIIFVFAFVAEASNDLGTSWLAVFGLIFCPTLLAGFLFAISTAHVRRMSLPLQPRSE